jgi:gliding motility-associated-like protein
VYCTGYFQNTVDFDPSVNTGSLTSGGKNDIFLVRYSLDGDYICSFNTGDGEHDNAYKLSADKSGNLYLSGYFSPGNVDFGPFASSHVRNSTGGADVFLAKYDWSNTYTPPSGHLVGDTVCEGDEAFLQFIATAGAGPFLLTYTDGTTVITQNVLESGEKFSVPGRATKTKQYTLTSLKNQSPCTPPGTGTGASIWVNPKPAADAGADTAICPGATIRLKGAGGLTYRWFPTDGLSDATVPEPDVTVYQTTAYHLVVTNEYGCVDTGTVTVAIRPADFKVKEINDVCIGDTITLNASGGDVYEWLPTDSLYPASSPVPHVWVKLSREYTVHIKDTVCGREAFLRARVEVHPLPEVKIYIAKDMDCGLDHAQLGAMGALTYTWHPADDLTNPNEQFTHARPVSNTLYTVTGTDNWGCRNLDTAEIKVFSGKGRLFAPDAFTPNLDGKNDCYRVHIPGEVTDFELSIANRWGQEVFHTGDFSKCWDGNFTGQQAELGTYFYFYKARSSICDDLWGKGDLQLIR